MIINPNKPALVPINILKNIPTNTNNKMDMSGGVILEEISDNSMYYVTISYNVIDNNGSILEDGIITSNSIKLN